MKYSEEKKKFSDEESFYATNHDFIRGEYYVCSKIADLQGSFSKLVTLSCVPVEIYRRETEETHVITAGKSPFVRFIASHKRNLY